MIFSVKIRIFLIFQFRNFFFHIQNQISWKKCYSMKEYLLVILYDGMPEKNRKNSGRATH